VKLRKLENKDAKHMLECMHDKDVVRWLQADFASKTIEDCERFIDYASKDDSSLHLAIVDDADEYMGTVSLRHIDKAEGTAEFAITIRKQAMGKGISKYGMEEILRMGLEDLGLSQIFWCVSTANERAIRFYNKGMGTLTDTIPEHILNQYDEKKQKELIWYVRSRG
jgi:diamine N-acetyltransferase